MKKIFENENESLEKLDSLFIWTVLATLLGARLGHVFFYDWEYYRNHLSEILLPFRFEPHFEFTGFQGLASHGAAIAIIVAMYYFSKKVMNRPLLWVLDRVVIPVQSEYLALHGVRQLLDTIDQVRGIYNPSLIVGGVLICLHDNRKRLARAVSDTIRAYFGDLVFNTVIRTNVALAEAPASGQTIFEYSSKSSGAEDYDALAKELLTNV